MSTGRIARAADRQHLARVVPLVERGCGIDALVALEADQAAAEDRGDGLRGLGLADAGGAFEQQRLAEREREIGGGREALAREVEGGAQRLLERLRPVDADHLAAERHRAQPRRACGRAPPWAWSARRIFSGVIGNSSMRTPIAL